MKWCLTILFMLFSYQAEASYVPVVSNALHGKAPFSNICYGHDGTCTNVVGCDGPSGCLGTVNEILRISPTMLSVWQTMIDYFGGNWTVLQTNGANWYTNARMAVVCKCNNVVNILVQQ
ncbi:MAG: hypothetical protein JO149_04930 [Gammaproteobacteria bacterium]|nr:hypothetical protein [Gammaproteobacteria bacterium]